jgi:iron complex outermembrane receptor protein
LPIHLHIKLLVAVCFLSLFSYAQNGKEKQLYKLKVIVTDSISGKPLEGATVSLTRHKHSHLTGQNGIVVFDTLKAGQYHVACTYIGYHTYEQTITLPEQQVVKITLCPSSYHLHEMVIKDRAQHDIPTYSIQSSAILTSSQIEKLRGQNLGDLLKNINGMTTLSTGPGIAKPVLRGLHSNRLVMLNNGVKQEGQQWGAEHAPEIDPFSLNKVEVIKGAASVEYGPEAIGGAIRLLSREYRANNGIGGEISLQGYSNNLQGAASAMLEGTHFKNQQFNWRVQGTLRKAGDSRAPDYVISNTGFDEQNGSVALAYTYKRFTWSFLAAYLIRKLALCGQLILEVLPICIVQ